MWCALHVANLNPPLKVVHRFTFLKMVDFNKKKREESFEIFGMLLCMPHTEPRMHSNPLTH